MRTAVIVTGERVDVRFLAPRAAGDEQDQVDTTEETDAGESAHEEVPDKDLNPIFPELKEVAWGFGSFIVFALLMRAVLYPRLRRGIDARYGLIRSGHEEAEQITAAATGDADAYESQLVAVKAEAAQRVDAARAALERERSERLAEVNAGLAERRAAAVAELDAARAGAQDAVHAAVRDVAAAAGRLATGREPDATVVAEAVDAVMSAGVAR